MVIKVFQLLVGAALLLFASSSVSAEVIYSLDFSSAKGTPAQWFKERGWEMKKDIEKMNLRFENEAFIIEPEKPTLGIIGKKFAQNQYLRATSLRIEWGVYQYPEGADWSGPNNKKRNTREPISIMLFFGEKNIDSGASYVMNLPYFLSFFLGKNEKPESPYLGNFWQLGGRYYCIPCDGSEGKTFITEVNLLEKFKEAYGMEAPPITSLAIEVDTQETQKLNGRHSKAFIKKIEWVK